MFHRILSPRDPRWQTCDPEYTLSDELFACCLDFFKRHYHVVTLDDLLAARSGRRALPDRPLLITFDDGWSDNEEFALPHLEEAGLPAVLFVAGAAVDRSEAFWQERLIHAWRAGHLDAAGAIRLWRDAGGDAPPPRLDELEGARAIVARLEALPAEQRARALAGASAALADPARYMVTSEQLRHLAGHRVAIGAHGHSHDPLTEVDAGAELTRVRDLLARHVAAAPALSFPHGRFDDGVVARARDLGYQLLFTSVPELPPASGRGPGIFGRVGFTTETITERGRFAPEKLALHLFRKPHARA